MFVPGRSCGLRRGAVCLHAKAMLQKDFAAAKSFWLRETCRRSSPWNCRAPFKRSGV